MKFFILLTLFLSASAFAIPRGTEGHGGGGWLCENPKDNEILDLWEARELYQLNVKLSEASVESQVADAIARIAVWNPRLGQRVEKLTTQWMKEYKGELPKKSLVLLSDGTEIDPPPDAKKSFTKKGCRLIGIALYTDMLRISPSFYESLPKTHKAALWLHEAVYFVLRDMIVETDSVLTRKIVGELFSPSRPLPPKAVYRCAPKGLYDIGEAEIRVIDNYVELQFVSTRFSQMFPYSKHVKVIEDEDLAKHLMENPNSWEMYNGIWFEELQDYNFKAALQDHEKYPQLYHRTPERGDMLFSMRSEKDRKVRLNLYYYLQRRFADVRGPTLKEELICERKL